jgi:hypothetical protein
VGSVTGMWVWGWFSYESLMFDRKTLVPTVFLFQSFLKLWVVSETCHRLAEDRRIGALELLLSTPLTTREILHGQWLALKRQFAKPLAAALVLEFLLLRQQFALSTTLMHLAMLLADLVALVWVGMWLGLAARNLSRAILGTIARVLILPTGAYFVGMFALEVLWPDLGRATLEPGDRVADYVELGIRLASDFVFGICWARRHLVNHFRQAAMQRYEASKFRWLTSLIRRKDVEPVRAPMPVRET